MHLKYTENSIQRITFKKPMLFNSVAFVFNLCMIPPMSNGSSYADFFKDNKKKKALPLGQK